MENINKSGTNEAADVLNDANNKTPLSHLNRYIPIPSALDAELVKMRRDPQEFTVLRMARCKMCYEQVAFELGHPLNSVNAGSWCPTHGWLAFDSVKIRPRGEEYIPRKRNR